MARKKTKLYAIHLGKRSKKKIRKFGYGGVGKMKLEIQQILDQMQSQMDEDRELIPIIVIHRRKKKKTRPKKALKKWLNRMTPR